MTLDDFNGWNALLQKNTFYGAHQKILNEDRPILSVVKCRPMILHCVQKKRSHSFSLHNFNKCIHSFIIWAWTILRSHFTKKIKKIVLHIITSLRSDQWRIQELLVGWGMICVGETRKGYGMGRGIPPPTSGSGGPSSQWGPAWNEFSTFNALKSPWHLPEKRKHTV